MWDQFTDPAESAAVDAIYESFTEQNPNITITREVIQTEQMRQTANTALASGTGPDVIFYDAGAGYAGVLAEAGLIIPLEDMADQYGWRERFPEQTLDATSIDGTLYGLPLQVDLIGMYYNQTLLEQEGYEIPQTVEELKTLCQEASGAGYVPMAFANNPGWQAFHQFSMMTTNMIGPEALEALLYENQGSWDSPEITEAIGTYFVELQEAGCFSEDANALTQDDALAMFLSGQSLMFPTGSWEIQNFTGEQVPEGTEITMMPFPEPEGGQGSYWVSGVGSAYYISANSPNQEAAGQFLDYLFSDATAGRWVQEAQYLVPMSVDTSEMDLPPLFAHMIGQLDLAASGEIQLGYNIDVIAPPEFNETMMSGFQAVIAGDRTPEEQASLLQAAWEVWWETQEAATPAS
ncbi:MAG: extracellular solute-binding protein [Chloroflexota bacterium]|nr:extracellular solute-binding protein [Chloroflexota bacterium]